MEGGTLQYDIEQNPVATCVGVNFGKNGWLGSGYKRIFF